jgi:hypothetical protein
MTSTKTPVANTFKLEDISPKRGQQFSPNLHAYLKAHKGDLWYAKVYRDKDNTLWLGYYYDGDFLGTRLMEALCMGKKAKTGCYGHQLNPLTELEGFWDNYLKLGRCAIDPEHEIHFIDDTRWKVEGNTRHCLWCNKVTQTLEKFTKTIEETRWVNA